MFPMKTLVREQAWSAIVEYSRIVLKSKLTSSVRDRVEEGLVSVGKPLGEPRTDVTDSGCIERELTAAFRRDERNAGCVPLGEDRYYAIGGGYALAHG